MASSRWVAAFAAGVLLACPDSGRADGVDAGRAIAHDQEKGNCLACHQMPRDPLAVSAATMGPKLQDVRIRYPDQDVLRQRIWDASRFNPSTIMPPYGRHRILTEKEIDLVAQYIHGL